MSKIAKTTIYLMVATIIAKVLGFGRELVLASAYGATMYSDAYLVAMNIPGVIFAGIGAAIGTTFIPVYFEVNNNFGEKRAEKFTNNIFNIVVFLCIILSIVSLIFIEPLVKLFAYGFNEKTFNITVNFTRTLILGIVFIGASNILTAYLQVKNNFIIPGIISLPYNVIIIISIILSTKYGPYTMVWGTLFGIISQFLIQVPFAMKYGYKYGPLLNIKDEYIKKVIFLLGPVFIGIAVNQVNTMVDRTLASGLIEGSISALNYSSKLNTFIMALFISSVSSVIYPMLSRLSAENDIDKFTTSIIKCINIIIILVIPISIGAIILSNPIVKLLFQRGAFDSRATNMTSIALGFYSFGLIGFGLREILGKVFYSLKDTKTPMINGALAMVMNIILNIILVKFMGHGGLALATSLSAIITVFLLFNSLKKKIGYFGQDKIIKTTFKSIISAIVMGIITYFAYNFLNNTLEPGFITEAISLFGSIGIGAMVYGVCVIVLKVEEVSLITDTVRKKLKI